MARRKLTEDEKIQNKIDRHNRTHLEKDVAAAPLFAEQTKAEIQAESWDVAYWKAKKQLGYAKGAEDTAIRESGAFYKLSEVLDFMTEEKIRRLAREHLPPDVHDALTAYRWRVYPGSTDYGFSFWFDLLAGRRINYAMHGEPIPGKNVNKVVVDAYWPPDGSTPPYTVEQLRAMFPADRWAHKPDPAPFDSAPFDLRQWLSRNPSGEVTP